MSIFGDFNFASDSGVQKRAAMQPGLVNQKTLRDEYVMAALTGLLAGRPDTFAPDHVDVAFEIADACMAKRGE